MRLVATCAAAASLVAGVITQIASSADATRCVSSKVAAHIDGRAVCLAAGQACSSQHRAGYASAGFLCRSGRLVFDWRPLRRPLHVPSLPPGAACPATPATARGFGPGPAYATLGDSTYARIRLTWKPTDNRPYLGWAGTKVLWRIPGYHGAVLVRGRRLDGVGEVGFDLGPQWTGRVLREIELVGPHPNRQAATFVRAPGCYAYQVDTLRSSYVIVFEATYE